MDRFHIRPVTDGATTSTIRGISAIILATRTPGRSMVRTTRRLALTLARALITIRYPTVRVGTPDITPRRSTTGDTVTISSRTTDVDWERGRKASLGQCYCRSFE